MTFGTMLSHLDDQDRPTIVDVSDKSVTKRVAVARGVVRLTREIAEQLEAGEIRTKKGPVFQTASLAGIMAAKQTSNLIPLCHPIALEDCKVDIELNDTHEAVVTCRAVTHHKTGVEMEALTGVTVAALTVYDMCKAMSHDISIGDVRLIEKRGGKSDYVYEE